MKPIVLLAAMAVALPAPATSPGTIYESGQELVVEAWTRSVQSFDALSLRVGGQEHPTGSPEIPAVVEELTLHYQDSFEEVEDGKPTRIQREYEEILRRTEGGEDEGEESGVLEGRSVRFSLLDSEVSAELADGGSEVDERHLEHFRLPYPEELFLPGEEVELGDSWFLADEATFILMGLAGDPALFEDDEEGGEIEELMREEMDCEIEVTFARVVERDEGECWVLTYSGRSSGELEDLDPDILGIDPAELGLPGDDTRAGLVLDGEGEGTLWISIEDGRFVEHVYTTEIETVSTLEQTMEQFVLELSFTSSVATEHRTTWSRP